MENADSGPSIGSYAAECHVSVQGRDAGLWSNGGSGAVRS